MTARRKDVPLARSTASSSATKSARTPTRRSHGQTPAQQLLACAAAVVHRPPSANEMKEFVDATGPLPKDYREVVERCGYLKLGSKTLFGLGPNASDAVNVDSVMFDLRVNHDLNWALIPLMLASKNIYICLDTSEPKQVRASTCPVVLWNSRAPKGYDQKCKRVAKTFAAWVADLVKGYSVRETSKLPASSPKPESSQRAARSTQPRSRGSTPAEMLLSSESATLHKGASPSDIRALKKTFGTGVPSDYIEYLTQCGWAELNGEVIYGLGAEASKAENVIESWKFESSTPVPMPRTLIPLLADGKGNHDCLDISDPAKVAASTCPVAHWQHDHPRLSAQKPRLVSKTFAAWIAKMIKEAEA